VVEYAGTGVPSGCSERRARLAAANGEVRSVRVLSKERVVDAVAGLVVGVNYRLGEDVVGAIVRALETETSETGRDVLRQILENAQIAAEGRFPICQDTGLAVVFAELGEGVRVRGGLRAAVTEGVRKGSAEGFLRPGVCDAFTRENTRDNTPAVIHVDLVPGDRLALDLLAKGGGSENMSRAAVLPPSAAEAGVVAYAVDTVRAGAVNACPPLLVGIGIGGDLERAATNAKRALLRPVGEPSDDAGLAALEGRTLERVNRLGIGPAGLGGRTTALAVHAFSAPCHIASLPVAVVLECHAHRHGRVIL